MEGIDSFNEWSVELGKFLVQRIIAKLASLTDTDLAHDSAVNSLMRRYRQNR